MSQSPQPVFIRQQLLVDEKVQGALLKRAGFYGVGCALYFVVILIFAEFMSRQDVSLGDAMLGCFGEAVYWLPGLLLMVPLIAYDMLKQSNRFAGPMFRLRREMQLLIAGKSKRPLNFRDHDYWPEMANEFNQIRAELQELRKFKAQRTSSNTPLENKLFDESEEVEEDDLLGTLAS